MLLWLLYFSERRSSPRTAADVKTSCIYLHQDVIGSPRMEVCRRSEPMAKDCSTTPLYWGKASWKYLLIGGGVSRVSLLLVPQDSLGIQVESLQLLDQAALICCVLHALSVQSLNFSEITPANTNAEKTNFNLESGCKTCCRNVQPKKLLFTRFLQIKVSILFYKNLLVSVGFFSLI